MFSFKRFCRMLIPGLELKYFLKKTFIIKQQIIKQTAEICYRSNVTLFSRSVAVPWITTWSTDVNLNPPIHRSTPTTYQAIHATLFGRYLTQESAVLEDKKRRRGSGSDRVTSPPPISLGRKVEVALKEKQRKFEGLDRQAEQVINRV